MRFLLRVIVANIFIITSSLGNVYAGKNMNPSEMLNQSQSKVTNFKKALKKAETVEQYIGVLKSAHEENIPKIRKALASSNDKAVDRIYNNLNESFQFERPETQEELREAGYKGSFEPRAILNAFSDEEFLANTRAKAAEYLKVDNNFERLKNGQDRNAKNLDEQKRKVAYDNCGFIGIALKITTSVMLLPFAFIVDLIVLANQPGPNESLTKYILSAPTKGCH